MLTKQEERVIEEEIIKPRIVHYSKVMNIDLDLDDKDKIKNTIIKYIEVRTNSYGAYSVTIHEIFNLLKKIILYQINHRAYEKSNLWC